MEASTRILGMLASPPAVLISTGVTVVLAAGLPSLAQWALMIGGSAFTALAAGKLERLPGAQVAATRCGQLTLA